MEIRYFYKVGSTNDIKVIYRLVVDNDNKQVKEQVWLNQQWNSTDNLIKQIIDGEINLQEVTVQQVNRFTPYVETN